MKKNTWVRVKSISEMIELWYFVVKNKIGGFLDIPGAETTKIQDKFLKMWYEAEEETVVCFSTANFGRENQITAKTLNVFFDFEEVLIKAELNLEKFLEENQCVFLKNKKEVEVVIPWLDSLGYKFGSQLKKTQFWDMVGKERAVFINLRRDNNLIGFGAFSQIKSLGFAVINYKEVLLAEQVVLEKIKVKFLGGF